MQYTKHAIYKSKMATEQFLPLPRAKSKAWDYFGFKTNTNRAIADKSQVFCLVCNPKMSVPYSGNTSNLIYYLQKLHKAEYEKVTMGKGSSTSLQLTIESSPLHIQWTANERINLLMLQFNSSAVAFNPSA